MMKLIGFVEIRSKCNVQMNFEEEIIIWIGTGGDRLRCESDGSCSDFTLTPFFTSEGFCFIYCNNGLTLDIMQLPGWASPFSLIWAKLCKDNDRGFFLHIKEKNSTAPPKIF